VADVVYLRPGERDRQPQRARPLLRVSLGEVLRRHRLHQRRTLADVAGSARISMAYLSEVERGRKEASSEVLAVICDALRIELSDVVTEAGRIMASRARASAIAATRASAARTSATEASATRASVTGAAGRRPGDVTLLAA
jgi:transcriptional regulator with XRE-family HTH domain